MHLRIRSEGRKAEPADMISLFDDIEDQNTAAAVFAKNNDYEDVAKLEKELSENVRKIKDNHISIIMLKASNAEELKKLVEEKRKLNELHITISDS